MLRESDEKINIILMSARESHKTVYLGSHISKDGKWGEKQAWTLPKDNKIPQPEDH